jgi:hypothetical protein
MKRNYVSDWRTVGSVYVHRYSILSTDCVVYAAYERLAGHSSMTTHPALGVWIGEIHSRPLSANVDALPVGPARFAACDAFRAANDVESYKAILAVYPEAASGKRRVGMGQIEMWVGA